MKQSCEICRSLAYKEVKLQAVKVNKSDVCGGLVLSNPVTYDCNRTLSLGLVY